MSEQIRIPTLEADDIEVKIKQVSKNGALALLYKTARTDMRILDEMFGISGWQVDYQTIGDALYCTISIWDEAKHEWVRKQNCGIPSREDEEGNEKKGEASDAMKRAGFLLGIGRELYSSPFIWLNLPTKQDERNPKKYVLENPFERFVVTDIDYTDKRKICRLVIANQKTGEIVYKYGIPNNKAPQKKPVAPKQDEKPRVDAQNAEAPKATVTQVAKIPSKEQKEPKEWEAKFSDFIARRKINNDTFISWRAKAVKAGKENITQRSFKELSDAEWIELINAMDALCEEGFFNE